MIFFNLLIIACLVAIIPSTAVYLVCPSLIAFIAACLIISGVAKSKILSEKMMKNVKENLFFAFAYNTLGIPIAAGLLYPIFGVLLSPMFAAAAMRIFCPAMAANSSPIP